MTKLTINQKLVVARVLNRYIGNNPKIDYNKALIEAMAKWIGGNKGITHVLPPRTNQAYSF